MRSGNYLVRFKVDEYKVKEKGKEYSIVVFPFIEHMWAYDNYVEDGCYMVDATFEAYSMLKYAMAILVEASDKIIYFPCKQNGIGQCYNENYNLVLCTPKAQFRRSSWISIRRKLKNLNKITYVLQYNRKKLDDYCKKKLLVLSDYDNKYYAKTEIAKKMEKHYLQELIGENLFMVISKEECYINHFQIGKNLDEYNDEEQYGAWTAFGLIITETGIRHMKEKAGNIN